MKTTASHLAVVALFGYLVCCGVPASGDECPVASFAAAHAFYVGGSYPYSIAAGDFNRDGKMDLAVASSGLSDPITLSASNGNVSVLLGRGDGTFKVPVNYSSGISPQAVVVGDLNNDGDAILSSPIPAPTASLCFWAKLTVLSRPQAITVLDRVRNLWQWATSTMMESLIWWWRTSALLTSRFCWATATALSRPQSNMPRKQIRVQCRLAASIAMSSLI